MNVRLISTIAASLTIGVALGFALPKSAKVADTTELKSVEKERKPIENFGDSSTLEAMRERIRFLEGALARAMEQSANEVPHEERVVGNRRERGERGARGERGNFNPREMMERLKKEDPERYAQMTNNFERWRVRREIERTNRLDFLKSIDTSSMSAGTRSTHEKLLANTDKIAEIEAMLRDENTTDEERRELFGQIRELYDNQRQLNAQERDNLIEQISREVGMSAEDAAEFGATINEILQATEAIGGRGPGGPRGGETMGPPPPPPML